MTEFESDVLMEKVSGGCLHQLFYKYVFSKEVETVGKWFNGAEYESCPVS